MDIDLLKIMVFALLVLINKDSLFIFLASAISFVMFEMIPDEVVISGRLFSGGFLFSVASCVIFSLIVLATEANRAIKILVVWYMCVYSVNAAGYFLHLIGGINFAETYFYISFPYIINSIDFIIIMTLILNARKDALHILDRIIYSISDRVRNRTISSVARWVHRLRIIQESGKKRSHW